MTILESKFARVMLFPLSLLYGAAMSLRNVFYDTGLFKIHHLKRTKVISIGNISVGGTGKTPFAIFLARQLKSKDFKVAILSRGYKRKSSGTIIVSDGKRLLTDSEAAGDEPYLIARSLPDVPVVCESDRYQGGRLIEEKFAPDVIVLDDAFQHRRLHRDVDIVLIDATRFDQCKWVLPSGYLREPLSGLKRTDLICLSRADQVKNLGKIVRKLENFSSCSIVITAHKPARLIHAASGDDIPFESLKKNPVSLFSGIGNPDSFRKTIQALDFTVVDHLIFSDHHQFSLQDVNKIKTLTTKSRANAIITTEKDIVRLLPFSKKLPENLYYLLIEFDILQGEEKLLTLLDDLRYE